MRFTRWLNRLTNSRAVLSTNPANLDPVDLVAQEKKMLLNLEILMNSTKLVLTNNKKKEREKKINKTRKREENSISATHLYLCITQCVVSHTTDYSVVHCTTTVCSCTTSLWTRLMLHLTLFDVWFYSVLNNTTKQIKRKNGIHTIMQLHIRIHI